MEKIRVAVLVPSTNKLEIREIDKTLEAYQQTVGGYIEVATRISSKEGADIDMICDEEGKFKAKKPCVYLDHGDWVVGTVFFARAGAEDWESLTDDDIEAVNHWLFDDEVDYEDEEQGVR